MADGSSTKQRRGEKTACVGTWVRPELKRDVERRAENSGQSVAEYLRRLLRQESRRDRAAVA